MFKKEPEAPSGGFRMISWAEMASNSTFILGIAGVVGFLLLMCYVAVPKSYVMTPQERQEMKSNKIAAATREKTAKKSKTRKNKKEKVAKVDTITVSSIPSKSDNSPSN